MGVPVLPNKGQWGNDVNGYQVNQTNSVTAILALILGALQQMVIYLSTGGGGGSGGNVTIVGTTPTGNTNSVGSNISPAGSVTIPAGAVSIEFILFPSAVGIVNGITFDNTTSDVILIYRLDAAYWRPLTEVTYELTAGTGALTVQT